MTDAADKPAQSQYSVTIWETIAIALAGVSLVAIGTAGLVYKFFSNAANPQRATLIARSLMDYQIPGGAQGAFGSNFGGAKVAIVTSPGFPRDGNLVSPAKLAELKGVELFIARVPLDVETYGVRSLKYGVRTVEFRFMASLFCSAPYFIDSVLPTPYSITLMPSSTS